MINRPQPDEYSPFAAGYINQVETTDVIGLLERLKDSTYELFSSLSDKLVSPIFS